MSHENKGTCDWCLNPISDTVFSDGRVKGRYCSRKCANTQHEAIIPSPNKDQPAPAVDHPPHYNQGPIECIDALQACLTPEEFRGFCKGNALKYLWRERGKGGAEDLEKAAWYLGRMKG